MVFFWLDAYINLCYNGCNRLKGQRGLYGLIWKEN